LRLLSRGWELSLSGAALAFVCWGIWAADGDTSSIFPKLQTLLFVLVVAAGLFALCRLIGLLILVRWLGRTRRTARLSHLAASIFLVLVGLQYLSRAGWLYGLMDTLNGWLSSSY
ncbi:MAG: hypothetical protein H0T78_01905, partial [Longispora sp.]|nr:hypothetical protein [Longispora sp. (in: high G+C Gram-positive bacteria)]